MLKTQLALRPLPLGCYWPASATHPLAERIALLARRGPGLRTRALGLATVGLTAAAVGWSAWAARPPELVWEAEPVAAAVPPAPAATAIAAAFAPKRPPPPRTAPKPPRLELPVPADPEPPEAPPAPELAPALTPVDAAIPPEGCGDVGSGGPPRRLEHGDFGPGRRIHAAADWSSVEPGAAVRVYATTTDPQGVPLITDLTAFGSQSWYRVGCIRNHASPERLFTSVAQHGGRLVVTALIKRGSQWLGQGSIELGSGESGIIALPDGHAVRVMAVARAETAEELQAARRTGPNRLFVNVERFLADA
jgi:hypothetical protein